MFESIEISMVTAMYLYIFCFGIGLLFMAILYVFIKEQRGSYLNFFLFFLFGLIGAILIALRETVGYFIGIIVANGLIITGFLMIPYGIRKVFHQWISLIPFFAVIVTYLILFIYGTYFDFNVGFRIYAFNLLVIFILLNTIISVQVIRRSKPYMNEIMTMALVIITILAAVRLVSFAINGESTDEFLQYHHDSFYVALCGISVVFIIPGLLSIIQSQQSEKLHQLSQIDALTGLHNRRSLMDYATRIWRQSKRDKVWISVFMLDIDYFKKFNDTHGHAYGDVILREVANVLNQVVKRPLDVVSRYGGEEFVLVLYECDFDSARKIADDIHSNVKGLDCYLDNEKTKPLSVSVGYVSLIATEAHNVDMMIKQADTLMYQSKEKTTNKTTGKTIE